MDLSVSMLTGGKDSKEHFGHHLSDNNIDVNPIPNCLLISDSNLGYHTQQFCDEGATKVGNIEKVVQVKVEDGINMIGNIEKVVQIKVEDGINMIGNIEKMVQIKVKDGITMIKREDVSEATVSSSAPDQATDFRTTACHFIDTSNVDQSTNKAYHVMSRESSLMDLSWLSIVKSECHAKSGDGKTNISQNIHNEGKCA